VLEFVPLKLTVWAQDTTGHFSEPGVFPLFIQDRATQEAPPQGVFEDVELGPVMVTLYGIMS